MRISEILSEARIYNQEFVDKANSFFSRNLPERAKTFIIKLIKQETQNQENQTIPKLRPDATEWDKKDLENGTLVNFSMSDDLSDKLDHIWDWLQHKDITEQDLDSLRGIQNTDIAYEHANRFFARLRKKASSDEDESGIETVMTWPDGFRLVKLNTAQCLDREGKLMQHCVGSYADRIARGTEILSLRDPQNNPHVTIEKNRNDIEQIKGKNNKAPIEKYHKYIVDYLNKNNFNEIYDLKNIGLVKINDKIYELNNLPDNFTVDGNLDLYKSNITKLPENLTINGYLDIRHCPIKQLPKGLTVTNGLNARSSALVTLPDNLNVKNFISISHTNIKEFPESWDGKTIDGSLSIYNCPIQELPENLTINGNLNITNTLITKLPDTLNVDGSIAVTPGKKMKYIPKHLKKKIITLDV